MPVVVVTGPAKLPLSVEKAKRFLRIDHSDDDTLVEDLVRAATAYAERQTGRALITRTLRLSADGFPGAADGYTLKLPRPPLQAYAEDDGGNQIKGVLSVTADGVLVDPADYEVDTASEPGLLWPADLWPDASAIEVEYTAGYGDDGADVPADLLTGIRLLVGHWYANREAVVGGVGREVEFATKAIFDGYWTGGIYGDEIPAAPPGDYWLWL